MAYDLVLPEHVVSVAVVATRAFVVTDPGVVLAADLETGTFSTFVPLSEFEDQPFAVRAGGSVDDRETWSDVRTDWTTSGDSTAVPGVVHIVGARYDSLTTGVAGEPGRLLVDVASESTTSLPGTCEATVAGARSDGAARVWCLGEGTVSAVTLVPQADGTWAHGPASTVASGASALLWVPTGG